MAGAGREGIMAFRLEKEGTTSTPYILIDEEKGYMRLEGRCFHENAVMFFSEIDRWLSEYLTTDFGCFTFENATSYFNSSTTKVLYNMLMKLDEYATEKNKVIVNWITTEDNEVMVECGEDFRDEVENLEFNLIVS
jgi:hypothetical protein